jgi:GH35 family endo-1,4-beta-xylanase
MLAYMRYENGLKFKKVIFENENAAKLWLKQNGISNPNCYELVEVEFVKEDLKALKKVELEEKLQRAKENVEWFQQMCNRYKDDEIMVDRLNECIAECENIQKEIDNL